MPSGVSPLLSRTCLLLQEPLCPSLYLFHWQPIAYDCPMQGIMTWPPLLNFVQLWRTVPASGLSLICWDLRWDGIIAQLSLPNSASFSSPSFNSQNTSQQTCSLLISISVCLLGNITCNSPSLSYPNLSVPSVSCWDHDWHRILHLLFISLNAGLCFTIELGFFLLFLLFVSFLHRLEDMGLLWLCELGNV